MEALCSAAGAVEVVDEEMGDLTWLVFDGEGLGAEFEVGTAVAVSAFGVYEEEEVNRLLELFHFSYNQTLWGWPQQIYMICQGVS